jgi:hypothetical protein
MDSGKPAGAAGCNWDDGASYRSCLAGGIAGYRANRARRAKSRSSQHCELELARRLRREERVGWVLAGRWCGGVEQDLFLAEAHQVRAWRQAII